MSFEPRSMLFVPANRPDRFVEAAASGTEAIVLDLEDSVGVSLKVASRANLSVAAELAMAAGIAVYVRVNAVDTQWHMDDVVAAGRISARGIVVPKCEDPDVVAEVEQRLAAAESTADAFEIVLILETAQGILAADRLASPRTRTRRISFGAYDFARDMGVKVKEAGLLLSIARARVTLAAKAAGIQAIDTSFADIRDEGTLRSQTEEALALGFTGKFAIHPNQVNVVNDVFSPDVADIENARRILDVFRGAQRRGSAAVTADDQLVDYPMAMRSEAILARARQFGLPS